jgi:hypothetical protein
MELDELKLLINERMERVQLEKSPDDIALMLTKSTNSIVGKIIRSLIIELVVSVIFTIACIAVAMFAAYNSLRIYFGIFAVVCAVFIPVLYIKLNKTRRLTSSAMPVKKNLQTLIALIKAYIKRYFQLTMALIPITLIISFMLGYNDENLNSTDLSNPFFANIINSPLKLSLIIIYITGFSIGMYYFTKWYLKKLYGNYIHQLEELLDELDEAE